MTATQDVAEHTGTYFTPESETEHKRGNRGEDVPDYCANCHRPYMDHQNGACPVESGSAE